MQIVATKDEREILSRLCDDLAVRHAPLYKQGHLLIKSALNAPTDEPSTKLSKEERALLLYLECRAVDNGGRVDQRHMNQDDLDICAAWNHERFIETGRIASEDISGKGAYWCALSDAAFEAAAQERKARAKRMWAKRAFKTTAEKREAAEVGAP